ncbi:hypothetical protein XELAEV_18010353mg [Xenopus laevis]|uniref:Secreted protein n=1 Tax=Xenopus laevis TaxID=8355 RepID=A0A974DU03_XENLA|nr:hypothetical protein XELAEV_18010353mg [Xenopus laevis]
MCSTVLSHIFFILSHLLSCFFSESLKSTLHCYHEVHIHIQYPATLQLFIKHSIRLRNNNRYWYVRNGTLIA